MVCGQTRQLFLSFFSLLYECRNEFVTTRPTLDFIVTSKCMLASLQTIHERNVQRLNDSMRNLYSLYHNGVLHER